MKTRYARLVFCFFLIGLAKAGTALAFNPLDVILQPFAGVHWSGFYSKYAAFIDFVVFLLLFLGLGKATLEKRFPGRAGKYIVISIALMLSISLALFSSTAGFNLSSFGPVAAVMLLIVAGVVVYTFVRSFGAGTTWSAALGFLIAYFLILAIAPEIYSWIMEKAPFVAAILSIAVLVALLKLLVSVFSSFSSSKYTKKLVKAGKEKLEEFTQSPELKQEMKEIESNLSGVAEKAYKQEKDLVNNLQDASSAIEAYGDNPKAARLLGLKLRNLLPDEHNLLKSLQKLRQVDASLRQQDLRNQAVFGRAAQQYSKIPGRIRAGLRKGVVIQRQKLGTEKKISELEQEAKAVVSNIQYCISQAADALEHDKPKAGLEWIFSAISKQKQSADLVIKIKRYASVLKALVKKQISQSQAMVKEKVA